MNIWPTAQTIGPFSYFYDAGGSQCYANKLPLQIHWLCCQHATCIYITLTQPQLASILPLFASISVRCFGTSLGIILHSKGRGQLLFH